MLYYGLQALPEYVYYPLFTSLFFRAGAALITAFILSLIGGAWLISHARFFCSRVREYTPSSHQSKQNTPTMGGLSILGALLITMLLWVDVMRPEIALFLVCMVGFAAIGLWDDWAKVSKNKGIKEGTKFKAQLLVGALVAISWYVMLEPSSTITVPFLRSWSFSLGLLLIPWAIFVIVGASNAVNLTDGLDGLAAELLMRNFAVFSFICYCVGDPFISRYLFVTHQPIAEIAVVGAAAVGASLGFLWYNIYPARCFMGDVGSLPLGAMLAYMALIARQELLLGITGFIFVLETLSVFMQVAYFKRYGKRLFKLAPFHHHLELSGWHEVTITGRFALITTVLCALGLLVFLLG